MTAEELRVAAIALFGERGWMSRLAEALDVDRSTVSRWFGGLPVPGPAAAAVEAWLQLHALTGESPVQRVDEHGALPRTDRSRIMYIEDKSGGLDGPARIGRVYFSKTGKSLTYRGQTFQSLKGSGFKSNYFDVETGAHYWISGPRRDGADRLYAPAGAPVEIDRDIREEYWRDIRGRAKDAGPVANRS
jgi:hypothetical protein